LLSGAATIAVLVVVLLTVYNTEKKYTAGVQTLAGLKAETTRLLEERKSLSGQIDRLSRETTEARANAEAARSAAAALSRDAAARDAAVEERNKAEAERRQIEGKKTKLAGEVETLGKERDALSEKIKTLARSHDANSRAAEVMREGRKAAEAAIVDAQKRQAAARDRAKLAEEDATGKREQAETRRAELARISAEFQSSQSALTDQQRRIAKAEEQHSKLAADIQDQQDLLTKLQDQAKEDAAHARPLRNEIETLTDSRDRLSMDVANLKSALSWLEPRVAELGALQARSGEIRDAYAKQRQEERAQKLELENNRREAVTLQQQITSRRETLAELTVSRNALQKKLAELQKQIDALEANKGQVRETAETSVE
jgi:chromosome segregation ATPase